MCYKKKYANGLNNAQKLHCRFFCVVPKNCPYSEETKSKAFPVHAKGM